MECGNGEGRQDDLEELTQDKTLIVNSGSPQIMDCLKVGGKSAERNYADHEKTSSSKQGPPQNNTKVRAHSLPARPKSYL